MAHALPDPDKMDILEPDWVQARQEPETVQRKRSKTCPDEQRLTVMSLNLQYYSSYPTDEAAAEKKLFEATGGNGGVRPDVIAVQEGLASRNVLSNVGYELEVCAGDRGLAQTVREMVYGDTAALGACPEHLRDQLLCNQIYVRSGSGWKVDDVGVAQISSDLTLAGGEGRCSGRLAVRSVVWVRLRAGSASAVVMCAHISGGRFEDQYFVQQLAHERNAQVERCLEVFQGMRRQDDVGILVGDFNACEEYEAGGAMQSYFNFGIASAPGVQADAERAGWTRAEELEEHFKAYMVAPFASLREKDWRLAYGKEVGVTSAFGHLIDHVALSSQSVRVQHAEVRHLTNQKVGGKKPDTDLVITDHNAVVVELLI